MATLGGDLLYEELVWKKSPALMAHWQARKLRLTTNALVYLCPKRSEVKNEIDLDVVSSCLAKGRTLEVEAYDYKRGRGRTWTFKFDSPESAAVWSATIRRLIEDSDDVDGDRAAAAVREDGTSQGESNADGICPRSFQPVRGRHCDDDDYDDGGEEEEEEEEEILAVTDDDDDDDEEDGDSVRRREPASSMAGDDTAGHQCHDMVPGNEKKQLGDARQHDRAQEESWTYVSDSWVHTSKQKQKQKQNNSNSNSNNGGDDGGEDAAAQGYSEQMPTVDTGCSPEGTVPEPDRASLRPRREADPSLTCAKCTSPIHSSLGEYVLTSRNQAYHELCFHCRKCRKDLDVDDFVWVGDRFYHPSCVKCKTCEVSLIDQGPAFLHKSAMFCRQHSQVTVKRKLCARCDGEILYESLVDSDNNSYHPSCFQCKVCRRELSSYYKVGEDLLCPHDFAELHAPTCSRCKAKIIDDDIVCVSRQASDQDRELNYHHHRRCFTCSACACSLDKSSFFWDNTNLLCEQCFEDRKLPRCGKCKQKIKGKFIKAQNASFHAECFKCCGCGSTLESTFVQRDGDTFCEHCFYARFAERCFRCKQPIKDRHVMAFGEKFHVQCLVCTTCNCQLTGKLLRAENGAPVCSKACMEDLYARFDSLMTH